MREKVIEKKLVDAAKSKGGLALKFASKSFTGMPDRIVLLPFGHIGFVECKAPGEKPRELQIHRMKLLKKLGFKVYVLDKMENIGEIIDDIQRS